MGAAKLSRVGWGGGYFDLEYFRRGRVPAFREEFRRFGKFYAEVWCIPGQIGKGVTPQWGETRPGSVSPKLMGRGP